MGLSAKLVMRQGQSLVMTPQLLQAIKLLQYSSRELSAFVEDELERNPLLQRAEDLERSTPALETSAQEPLPQEGDWSRDRLGQSVEAVEREFGTDLSSSFDAEPATHAPKSLVELSTNAWSGVGSGGSAGGEAPDIEAYLAAETTLREHLSAQVLERDPETRFLMEQIIDELDEAGYWRNEPETMAAKLGTSAEKVLAALAIVQSFEPTGIAARNLAECLALQLKELNRFDPAMAVLLDNLDLLAKKDFVALRKLCGVSQDDIVDMVHEIRELEPKPGRGYGAAPVEIAIPDVYIRAAPDGSWQVELNADALPRILVNSSYYARITRHKPAAEDKVFISNCLQNANWLTKSLEQRARTILKVASEIARHQDGFFAHGVEHLRPLNLKTVADAISMHESTVSRVTSNKYISCARGLFEMKYFFTASINAQDGAEGHSSQAVRFKIKQLIDAEDPADVLSDDTLVQRLKDQNIDIARRTVAKYRDSLKLGSSVERRREKATHQR